MCNNGINTGQFEQMIEQIDDHLKVERKWAHNMAHMAEDAGFEATGDKLHEVFRGIDEIRQLLDEAKDALEKDVASGAAVSVTLV
ncbi:MAG: dynein gamma chain protein [Eggerthellaceae bacterium]|nr:dynein gamma chain protein [Eggerthellaceae bacterium]